MDKTEQNAVRTLVDQLLREQGEYIPLEFLLLAGRLLFEDYETWCSSDIQFFDDMLFGDPEQIIEQLLEAENYAQALGLEADPITYHHWQKEGNPTLVFSHEEILNQCFHKKYIKSSEQPQMDMFMDNPAGNLIGEITLALKKLDQSESRRIIERLYDMAPDQTRLGELEVLVNALEQLHTPIIDNKTALQNLTNRIVPAAQIIMGNEARSMLIPYWQRLSHALQNTRFDVTQAEMHVSYTSGQALDWEQVIKSIEKEPQWQQHSLLVQRHAHACSRLDDRSKAVQSWFYLCWFHPGDSHVLNNVPDLEIRNKWKDFLSLDPELPTESFPAWLLLFMPGIINILPETIESGSAKLFTPPESYEIIHTRQKNKIKQPGSLNTDEIQWRAELKQHDSHLFRHYIAAV